MSTQIDEILGATAAWTPNEGTPSDQRPGALAVAWGKTLPADFAAIVRWDGGHLRGETSLYVDSTAQLVKYWNSDHLMPKLPSAVVFGHDGGGSFFYFDTDGSLGHGAWSVYIVRMSEKSRSGSIFAGYSLTDVVEAIVRGDDLFDRDELGP